MHLHHAMFYVLGRWGLNAGVMGAKQPVDANEQAGWKDTVRVNPGQVTRLLVRFDNQGDTANNYTGHYVFHCHLLEHEDMGMMRPLEIFP
jgi:spore coat protein A